MPAALLDYLAKHRAQLAPELAATWSAAGGKTAGTWAEVFGGDPAGEEIFMAWYFADYTQAVAAAGKAELSLPMYANAALIRPGYQPGQYPSAGPLPHLIDVWRAAAPALDFLSPDIYFQNFSYWAELYTRSGNPLFIPEAMRSPEAAVNALYAFGALDAIGFCPFAIESNSEPASGYPGGELRFGPAAHAAARRETGSRAHGRLFAGKRGDQAAAAAAHGRLDDSGHL